MTKYFVWLSGQNGPQAQVWHNDVPKNGNGKPQHEPIFKIELTDENAKLSLDDLILKFKDEINAI